MIKINFLLIVFSTLFVLNNCASFRENNLPIAQENDYKTIKTEKIKVFSRWTYNSTAPDAVLWAAAHKSWFDKAILESGCCSLVEGPKDANIVVDGTAYDRVNYLRTIPLILSSATLTILPYWQTMTVDIKVTVTKGNKQNNYELRDSYTMFQWLPMIVVMPFTGLPNTNRDELFLNTYQNLVIQMKKNGNL
ncbi:hypothetical protein [Leptospira limi]|uniref:Uncharacterized protein n=1 Tax=Leptospira limi TaxID=2950023 RepID=A0ABT3M267_9LEPT|nr:hypothetical protein [Leptospira limi]MCW7464063.1 hypothetical protein [Leptospira limi]